MHTNSIVVSIGDTCHSSDQIRFWLKMVAGWQREIGKMLGRNYPVIASGEVKIRWEKARKELSEISEKLDELSRLISMHLVTLPNADSSTSEWINTHTLLQECMHIESENIRNLLSEMLKLEQSFYNRILC